ncbi:MAG: phosphoadenosine phosphosulfate reductase family protein, partial [Thermoplasmata archaeon]|nr:phosphoadenosine phosphosulfate reductase family protein [Thermoplasmata archaeon]
MSIVRLGPIRFGWCLECNIPIVDVRFECGSCGSKPKPVSVTPPGDVRPAFKGDIELLGDLADRQFGDGCGSILFPDDKVIVLNKAPGLDRMDEVVIDGQVVCTLKFDIEKGYRLLLRLEGARRISRTAKRGRIHISADAVPYIVGGASVMVPGIEKADASIEKGDEVMVLDDNGDVIAVGFSRMSGRDMAEREKGAATKTRWSSDPSPPEILQGGKQWKDVIEGNRTALDGKIGKAIRFIHNVSRKHDLPLAVSFSGGKDSLVTLLLALDAGLKPEVIFVDTGLEFRETVDYVHALAEKMGLKLIVEDAGETFWDGLKTFGPPSKDFRWCCKSCKLGPTARLIREHFPDGVLSLIGQRRYESRSRAKKGGVWENPWVPGQVAASPVQNWTALDVWLYIFMKKADYNPWYERGMERIGCFLCPASDMAELGLIEERCEEYDRWSRFLRSYADGKGYDDRWIDMGLW